jgi:hypothetical protein
MIYGFVKIIGMSRTYFLQICCARIVLALHCFVVKKHAHYNIIFLELKSLNFE